MHESFVTIMGNQIASETSLKFTGQQQFSSISQLKVNNAHIMLSNPAVKKVHVFELGTKFTPRLEVCSAHGKPQAVELCEADCLYGTDKGMLFYYNFDGERAQLKVSDFRISEIARVNQSRVMVEENEFLNLIKIDSGMLPIFKMGHFDQKITRVRVLGSSEVVVASGKTVKFVDLERRYTYHSFTDFSRLLGLSVYKSNPNIVLGGGESRGCILFDKRHNYPLFSRQTSIADPHAVELIPGDKAIFGGVNGSLEVFDLRNMKAIEIKEQVHRSCIVDIGVSSVQGYSGSVEGKIMQFSMG